MSRQQKFEEAYAEAHGMPIETFAAYRLGDTYRLPMIAKCWRFWNMAIDSVVVELPDSSETIGEHSSKVYGIARDEFLDAIYAAGLRVAP